MDEDILEMELTGNDSGFSYEYPIIDQNNEEVVEPDFELGYLRKERFIVHHPSIPEVWHYKVVSFEFSNGEIYVPESEQDQHIRVIDAQKGIFEYVNLDGEEEHNVVGQTITAVIDQRAVEAWDEERLFYRYVLYTEKELADRAFIANGPTLLAEAQETIEDLILMLAELVGAEEEEEEVV